VAIGISADNERSLGTITLSWPDADQLKVIAQAAINVLQTQNRTYFPQMGTAPADVTILSQPLPVPAPPPLANRYAPFVRLGLGLVAGIGLAFLAHYLDPAVRRREDVERLGLAVIATLPHESIHLNH
jgi:capsular polysaccharide biosynthesis protein